MHSPTRRLGKNKDQQDTQGAGADVPSLQAGDAKGVKNTITEEKCCINIGTYYSHI